MAKCIGKRRASATCDGMVERCGNCTSLGCDQERAGECSNQGFRLGSCVKCGAMKAGQDLPLVMTPQLEEAIRIINFGRSGF
jgi:hypothetical protein